MSVTDAADQKTRREGDDCFEVAVACASANTLNRLEVVVMYEAKVARNGDPTKRDKKNEVAVINTFQGRRIAQPSIK